MAYGLHQVTKHILYLSTNSVDSSLSLGAQNTWAGQEIPRGLWIPRMYCHVYNASIPSHLNPVHSAASKIFKGKCIRVHATEVDCSLDSPSPDFSRF
jgi:hypothetical protein